jgi:hypothetical protein
MEETKIDRHTKQLEDLFYTGRFKKFMDKLASMSQDEREVSFTYVDPETKMTFLESAK